MEESKSAAISEKKEYSSLLAVREYIDDLVKNCFALYDSFNKAVQADEAQNEPIKLEFRNYKYYHSVSSECQVYTYGSGNSKFYKDYTNFSSAVNGGLIRGLDTLTITLDMSYRAGTWDQLVDHDHKFVIKFRPDGASLSYDANFDDPAMNDIYNKLAEKLDAFPATMTIFSKVEQ